MRKKLSEMTPFERVLPRLKGLSNEEAEDIAIKILAQVGAKHFYVFCDGDKYFDDLLKKLSNEIIEYSKNHSYELALGKVFYDKNK